MNKTLVFSIALFSALSVSAQTFVKPVEEKWLSTANEITIIPVSGDSVTGASKMVTVAGSQIRRITIKDKAGTKHAYEAEDIKLLKLKLSKLAKAEQVVNTASESIENAINTNYAALTSMGYAVWEQVKKPDGDDGSYLLQVLNPWFCDYMKVYNVPKFVTVSGGFGNNFEMPDELLVVRNGKTTEITKKKYKKVYFLELFGDCPEFVTKVVEKERDWDDFPEHVKLYSDCMKKKGGN